MFQTTTSAGKARDCTAATTGINAYAALFRPVLYPAIYPWFVVVAFLDILTTWIILNLGGSELNPLAARAIAVAGVAGMVLLKLAVVVLVLVICECVGRARTRTGRRLAWCSVALNCVPVGAALLQLALYAQPGWTVSGT
jgi:hypothetical protein